MGSFPVALILCFNKVQITTIGLFWSKHFRMFNQNQKFFL